MFVKVAVNIPSDTTFEYSVPDTFTHDVHIGKRVLVPFGKRKVTGYVIAVADRAEWENPKDIIEVLDRDPLFHEEDLLFYQWISNYYIHPLGKTLKAVLPSGIDTESTVWLSLTHRDERTDSFTPDQRRILEILGNRSEGISLKSLKKALPKTTIDADIEALKRLDLIARQDTLTRPAVRTKTEKIVSLSDGPDSAGRLTEKQQTIVDILTREGPMQLSALGEHVRNVSPTIKRLELRGVVHITTREVYRTPGSLPAIGKRRGSVTLTHEQKGALKEILKGIHTKKYSPYLLHGVTGSGKTEVYFSAIDEVLKDGGRVIFLVPEISLTPQLLSRVKERFHSEDYAILHSGISPGEKYDEWRRVLRQNVSIVIGVRSAIFAPVSNLRLIVVDEEHDPSYKQDEGLTYNARNLALVRAKLVNATVVLGSATPEIQTHYNAMEKNFNYLALSKRIDDKPLPSIEIVDMKEERTDQGKVPIVTRTLRHAISSTLEQGHQTILFLNRRGFTTFMYCLDCGYVFKCRNCSVSLTHHADSNILRCHYCDYTINASPVCPSCRGFRINSYGFGTEKAEHELRTFFPDARITRMDSDTTQAQGSHARILQALDKVEIDILIGTQMIAKGHDYPNVTLVGVLSADMSLNVPDFRSAERTFQLITQVAGRGGRGDAPGHVIVQTFNPHHYAITRACGYDSFGFYQEELSARKEFGYPPFSRMVNFRISGSQEERVIRCAQELGTYARQLCRAENLHHDITIIGPAEAPIARIKGRYRWQMLMMSPKISTLHAFTRRILADAGKRSSMLRVDIDPLSFM
jgi:primosomal protein N' (replication factor Y)